MYGSRLGFEVQVKAEVHTSEILSVLWGLAPRRCLRLRS